MSVIVNGGNSDGFNMSRGLRQGALIFPYLFVLCVERLTHLLDLVVLSKSWKPIKLSKKGPPLTHLFFFDDLVLFAKATTDQVDVIQHCF